MTHRLHMVIANTDPARRELVWNTALEVTGHPGPTAPPAWIAARAMTSDDIRVLLGELDEVELRMIAASYDVAVPEIERGRTRRAQLVEVLTAAALAGASARSPR